MRSKEQLKALAKRLLGRYEINRVYHSPEPAKFHAQVEAPRFSLINSSRQVAECEYREISKHAWYAEKPGYSYGIWEDGKLACFCSYWTNTGGNLPRWLRDIPGDEIVLVDIITAEQARGKGYATRLIDFSWNELRAMGYRKSWAWIWHSNYPSIRAFEKAGWTYDHFLVELPLSGLKGSLRLKLPRSFSRLFGRLFG